MGGNTDNVPVGQCASCPSWTMSKLKIVCVEGGDLLRQCFVRITQDRHMDTDTRANQYQLAAAADKNYWLFRQNVVCKICSHVQILSCGNSSSTLFSFGSQSVDWNCRHECMRGVELHKVSPGFRCCRFCPTHRSARALSSPPAPTVPSHLLPVSLRPRNNAEPSRSRPAISFRSLQQPEKSKGFAHCGTPCRSCPSFSSNQAPSNRLETFAGKAIPDPGCTCFNK